MKLALPSTCLLVAILVLGCGSSGGRSRGSGGSGCGAGPTIPSSSLSGGVELSPYSQCITVSGGRAPLDFSVVTGALPPGLALDPATGCLGGTPDLLSAGSYAFEIQVTDSCPSGPRSDTRAFTIDIIPAPCLDDAYEENDSSTQAFDLVPHRGVLLSSVSGPGILGDDDYFEVIPGPGNVVEAWVTFDHALGDIDAELVDEFGFVLDSSTTTTDDEHVFAARFCNAPVFLRVFPKGAAACNTYDILWESNIIVDCFGDLLEPNDDRPTASDLTASEQTWISSLVPWGPNLLEDDFYEILVDPGENRVLVDVTFTHAAGNIDIELQDAAGVVVASSTSLTDDESIDVTVPAGGGTYYVRVHHVGGCPRCNGYDLWWDDVVP